MDYCKDDDRLDNSFVRPTRFVRNSNVEPDQIALNSRTEPTFHDFILLAARIRPTSDHYAGHKTNIVLTGGSPLIGRGSSFAVYQLPTSGTCNGFRAGFVAVKSPLAAQQINPNSDSFKRQLRDAYFELQVLSHPPLRNHRNIIELLGISWEPSPTSLASFEDSSSGPQSLWPVLILEYSPIGSILEMFEDMNERESDPLTIEIKVNISLDVVRGLKAIHDSGIAHSDMKCENVLMFLEPPRLTAKIADFGCALSNLPQNTWIRGFTEPWNAPEVTDTLKGKELLQADVYSMGFVIWRIMTDGADPFEAPSVIAAKGQSSLNDFKMRDNLWELASADMQDRHIWDRPAAKISNAKSQLFFEETQEIRSYNNRIFENEDEDNKVPAGHESATLTSHTFFDSLRQHEAAREMSQVFENCLRSSPRARNMSRVLQYLTETQDLVCEIFDPEPFDELATSKPSYLPKHIQAVRRDESSNAFLFSSTEVSMTNMSDPDEYCALISHMRQFDSRVREYLVQSMGNKMKHDTKDITRALFIFYLDVDYDPKQALKWLLVAADSGDYVAQAIIHRIYSCLDQPLPRDMATIQLWLWNGAIRCSPIALEDLKSLNPVWHKQAMAAVKGKYGGIGIDVYQEFEVTMRMVAYGAKEDYYDSDFDSDDDGEDHSDGKPYTVNIVYPGWPGEVMKGIGHGRCDKYSKVRGDFWEPVWKNQPHQTRSDGYFYKQDPDRVLLSTFRMEEDGKMYMVSGFCDTVLHYAANRGFLQLVQFICEKYKPDVNETNIFMETPLLQSCRCGHVAVSMYLLSKGADAKMRSERGETPLHWIGSVPPEELESLVKLLIAGGASRESSAEYPNQLQRGFGVQEQILSFRTAGNALQWQVDQNNPTTLRALLDDAYGLKDIEFQAIIEAAGLAASLHNYDCLSLLIGHTERLRGKLDENTTYGWLVQAVDELQGGGRLYQLLRHGRESFSAFAKTLECLQKAGAKPLTKYLMPDSRRGWIQTVLFRSIMNPENVEIVRLLLDSGWGQEKELSWTYMTHIQRAIAWGDYETFVLLLERGFDPFEKVDYLNTGPECDAYMFCALSEQPNMRIVEKLHSIGVPYHESPTISPFEKAVRRGLFEMATFFLTKCGADINRFVPTPASAPSLGPFGRTRCTLLGSLISEYSLRSISSIKYLLEGYSLPLVNGNSATSNLIKPSFLVCEGEYKVTALHVAAGFEENTYEHITPFLMPLILSAYPGLEHIEAKEDFFDWTALFHATKCGNYEAVRLLLASGADYNIKDDCGLIPLKLAKRMAKSVAWSDRGRGGKSHVEVMKKRFSKVVHLLEEVSINDAVSKMRIEASSNLQIE